MTRPDFVGVARLIGDEALAAELACKAFFKYDGPRKTDLTMMKQMYEAADLLSRTLGVYDFLIGKGGRVQIDVGATVATLETVKADLASVMKPTGRGAPLDTRRAHCAHVVVSLWKKVHGEVNPRSEKLYAACDAYWQANGGEDIGDISNWRTYVGKANRQIIAPK